MFGNGSNNKNDASVNTKSITFYSDLSCLHLGYWNNNLSVRLNPIDGIDADGLRKYNFDSRISTAFTQEKAAMLSQAIDTHIMPVIESVQKGNGLTEKVSCGFSVGKGSAIFIEYEPDDKGVPTVFLTLYKDIKDDKTSTDFYRYKFNKNELVLNYSCMKGTGQDKMVESEFHVFYKLLNDLPAILGSSFHTNEYYNELSTKRSGNKPPQQSGASSYSAPVESYNEEDSGLPF